MSTDDHKSKIASLIAKRCKVHSSIRSQLLCVKQNADDIFANRFAVSKHHNHLSKYLKGFSLSGSRLAVSILSAAIRYGIVKSTAPPEFWLIFGISALEGRLLKILIQELLLVTVGLKLFSGELKTVFNI